MILNKILDIVQNVFLPVRQNVWGAHCSFPFVTAAAPSYLPRRQEAANLFARTNVVIPIIRKHVFCVKSVFTTCGKPSPDASESQGLTGLVSQRLPNSLPLFWQHL